MGSPLFFCDRIPAPGELLELDESESKHVSASRRLGEHEHIAVFDGAGTVAQAVIREVHTRTRRVSVEVLSRKRWPERNPRVHLAAAMPKGERQRTLFDMCTQLGVASITPLSCARSITKPSSKSKLRWRKICVSACKQSGQPYLPAIRDVQTPAAFADDMREIQAEILVAHPGGASLATGPKVAERVALLIGPEGGFTREEIGIMTSKGAVAVSLGACTLRVETAAVMGVGCLLVGGASPR